MADQNEEHDILSEETNSHKTKEKDLNMNEKIEKLIEAKLITYDELTDIEQTDYLNPEHEFDDIEEEDVSAVDVFKKLNEIWKILTN